MEATLKYERINANFITDDERELLRLMRDDAASRGQKMRFWIMQALREKLEREGALPPSATPKKK